MRKVFDGFVLIMVALVATAVGDIVVFGDSVGVALTEGAIGENISVDTVGVYELPVADADAVAVGDVLYYDETNKVFTTDSNSGANVRGGIAWSTKAGGVAGSVDIKIG